MPEAAIGPLAFDEPYALDGLLGAPGWFWFSFAFDMLVLRINQLWVTRAAKLMYKQT